MEVGDQAIRARDSGELAAALMIGYGAKRSIPSLALKSGPERRWHSPECWLKLGV